MLLPIFGVEYSAEDWRVIAGYLLYMRAGILRYLQSVTDPAAVPIPEWTAPQARYAKDAEIVTRWLLSYSPYPVQPNELWDGKTYVPRPQLGDPGRPVAGVQDDPSWLVSPTEP